MRSVWWALTLLSTGCFQRVVLAPPPAGADLEARAEAFQQLVPVEANLSVLVATRGPGGPGRVVAVDVDQVRLAGGHAVEDPRDLAPLVSHDSRTAIATEAWRRGSTFWGVSLGIGASLLVSGLLGLEIGSRVAQDIFKPVAIVSLTTAVIGLVGGVLVPALAVGNPERHRQAAFAAYPADLFQFLRLSAEDLKPPESTPIADVPAPPSEAPAPTNDPAPTCSAAQREEMRKAGVSPSAIDAACTP